jgi:HAD superfamily hydrolase (TIGR01509 family)
MSETQRTNDILTRRRRIRSALLDLDGVLVDSEPVHGKSWQAVLGPLNCSVPGGWESWIGVPDQQLARRLFEDHGLFGSAQALLDRKRQAYRRIAPQELDAFDGVAEGIGRMQRRGWPVLVVTSSTRQTAQATLAAAGLEDLLAQVVAFEDTAAHKPDPQPYIEGARRAGADPRQCVVIEDSAAGLAAARRAGCLALGIGQTLEAKWLQEADKVFSNTREALDWVLASEP